MSIGFLSEFDSAAIEQGAISICARLDEGIVQNDVSIIGRALCTLAYVQTEIPPDVASRHDLFTKLKAAEKIALAWRKKLSPDAYVDVFDGQFNAFYAGKILSRDGNMVNVHFLGWTGYDLDVDVIETPIYPIYTITKAKRKANEGKEGVASSAPENERAEAGDEEEQEKPAAPSLTTGSGRVVKLKMAPQEVKPAREPSKKKEMILELDGRECNTDNNEFLCYVCGHLEHPEQSEMLLCDGPCLRSGHYECVSADERKRYDSLANKEEDQWYCGECHVNRHSCFICKTPGDDFSEVNKCSMPKCGKYYHAQCLLTCPTTLPPPIKFASKEIEEFYAPFLPQPKNSKSAVASASAAESVAAAAEEEPSKATSSKAAKGRPKKTKDVEVAADETNLDIYDNYQHPPPPFPKTRAIYYPSQSEPYKAFTFKCPHHMCHNCYPIYGFNGTPELRCIYCPRAYHENCLPPRARCNTLVIACSVHSTVTLPHEKSVKSMKKDTDDEAMEGDINFEKVFGDVITPKIPKATDDAEMHYRLTSTFSDDIKAEPRPFKSITRLKYDLVNLSEMPLNHTEDVCSCKDRCGPGCFNRQVKIECNDSICNLGSGCGNRRLQNMQYAKTIRFPEFEMGWGLKAGEFIPDDSLVIEYIGEVIDREEMKKRMFNQRQNTPSDKDYYIMALEGIYYVDGKHFGNESRFINHSCDPNCELQLWHVNGRLRIGICAIRDIQPDEPLSYDYQFDTSEEDVFKCYCKTQACRGTMAPKKKPTHHSIGALGIKAKRAMIEEYRKKVSRKTREQMVEEEVSRSLTSKFLPGDKTHAIRDGPPPSNFRTSRQHGIFLPRNALAGSEFEKRRRLFYNLPPEPMDEILV